MKDKFKKVPEFRNEEEEFEFWSAHDITDYIDISKGRKAAFSNLKPTSKLISIQMPVYLLNQIKMLAHKKDIPYQSLMKVYLAEKAKEEVSLAK